MSLFETAEIRAGDFVWAVHASPLFGSELAYVAAAQTEALDVLFCRFPPEPRTVPLAHISRLNEWQTNQIQAKLTADRGRMERYLLAPQCELPPDFYTRKRENV